MSPNNIRAKQIGVRAHQFFQEMDKVRYRLLGQSPPSLLNANITNIPQYLSISPSFRG